MSGFEPRQQPADAQLNIELRRIFEPKLFQFDSPEGPRLEIDAGEDIHSIVSWPNADPEIFIENTAQREEGEARSINIRNRLEMGMMTIVSGGLIAGSLNEANRSGNKWYLLGVLGGLAGIGFGIHHPHGRSTREVQKSYRDYAAAIRSMPRKIHKK